ncbi:MAG: orotate phosphoribosyltransferase [Lysobacterales bacterium RIFOXYD1_FULL_69_11]|nr:MAG: orotate phosphoribosyltransferase [Xanthomonadales bacterium RIFOXYA1_FULL_69_10]OHE88013.1 MAG: orotate phosphoribosyltransferase [Xanthomonadales bacterium RIFOXYD1_FULL_69_11]
MSDFEQQPPPVTDTPSDGISAEQRQWAMFAHLSALVGGVITGGWAFSVGCFIGPLIIWMIKKDSMPFVDDQAKEALNFNLTVAAIFFVLLILTLGTLGIGVILTLPIGLVVGLAWLVLTIIAGIKANEGVAYRYPFAVRLVK